MKTAVVLFLFGVFTFTIAYAALFLATDVIDYSMHKQGEETWPEYLFWVPDKSAEEYKTMAKWEFGIALFGGLASFSIFIVGLLVILAMATHFQLGLRFASFNCFASSYRRTTASGDGSRPHDSLLAAFRFVAFLSSSPLKSAAGPKARGTAHTNFVTL